jgi:Zn finger protein HypA/HybF involved in hydrogenase expression
MRGRNRFKPKPKGFKCNCGAEFFKNTTRKSVGCTECKGVAKANPNIRPKPYWTTKEVKVRLCPKCHKNEMKCATGDAATIFNWVCSGLFCNYVC